MDARCDNRLTVIEAVHTADWKRTVIEAWATHPNECRTVPLSKLEPGQLVTYPPELLLEDGNGATVGIVTNIRVDGEYLVGDQTMYGKVVRMRFTVHGKHNLEFGSLISRESKKYLHWQDHELDTVTILRLAGEVEELPAL